MLHPGRQRGSVCSNASRFLRQRQSQMMVTTNEAIVKSAVMTTIPIRTRALTRTSANASAPITTMPIMVWTQTSAMAVQPIACTERTGSYGISPAKYGLKTALHGKKYATHAGRTKAGTVKLCIVPQVGHRRRPSGIGRPQVGQVIDRSGGGGGHRTGADRAPAAPVDKGSRPAADRYAMATSRVATGVRIRNATAHLGRG